MSQPTTEQLQRELATLTAEKAELARQLDLERSRSATAGVADVPAAKRNRRGWGWTVLSTALVAIGVLLAPVAVVSTWAHRELTDTAYFVNTFAPLAQKPEVQDFVAAEAVAAIDSAIDLDEIADNLFTGLDGLDLTPRAKEALVLLKAPAVAGVRGLISSTVTEFVRSDAFATIWKDAITITHQQLVSTATGQKDAAVSVGNNQEISLNLGPIIRAVKEQLVADGFGIAANIPEISRSIVIAEAESVGLYLTIYQLVVAIGIWLPWVSLLIVAAGVLVARRRALALAWAASALLLTMVLVGSGISIGKNVFALAVSSSIPQGAALALYSGILAFVSDIVVVVAVLAAAVLIITLFAGPWRWARRLRSLGSATFASLRETAERHRISTGRTGEWLYRWRIPLRIAVAVVCSAILVFNRPLAPAMIVWTAIIGVVVVAALELAARPPRSEPVAP